jgi:hypothetical protein
MSKDYWPKIAPFQETGTVLRSTALAASWNHATFFSRHRMASVAMTIFVGTTVRKKTVHAEFEYHVNTSKKGTVSHRRLEKRLGISRRLDASSGAASISGAVDEMVSRNSVVFIIDTCLQHILSMAKRPTNGHVAKI